MRMPPFMRQSNAAPLTLAAWQYERPPALVVTPTAVALVKHPIRLRTAPTVAIVRSPVPRGDREAAERAVNDELHRLEAGHHLPARRHRLQHHQGWGEGIDRGAGIC